MGTVSVRIRTDDIRTPAGAYNRAREYCLRAVRMQQEESIYVGEAIKALTMRYGFGSWLLKLFKGQTVSIHLHYYETLVEAVEKMAAAREQQIIAIKNLANAERGRRHASVTGGRGMAQGGAHVLAHASRGVADRG